ncbi:MAG: TetR/AcrR family transcriptional regulator [Candidatus Hodarchaeota archaeon]
MSDNEIQNSPRKRRLERERKQRRNDIIKTAEWFFANQGYDQTMVDQIAVNAGYSKATIYNYFDSKDDLFVAVAAKALEKMFQIMQSTFGAPNAKYVLKTLGDGYLKFAEEYPDLSGLLDSGRLSLLIGKMVTKEETKQSLTESEKEFRNHQLQIERLMMDVITKTMKDSGVQTDLDPFSVVMALSTLGSAINELIMRGKRTNQPENKSREYLAVLFNIIDKGLKHYDN